jgi:hypothetical protein
MDRKEPDWRKWHDKELYVYLHKVFLEQSNQGGIFSQKM